LKFSEEYSEAREKNRGRDKGRFYMIKNLLVLCLFTWVCFAYAKDHSIAHDSMADAEAFKVEKPTPEQEAKRSLAGSKIKKKKNQVQTDEGIKDMPSDSDSEVRYWQYSE
jgi:hypothetical protein